MNQHHQDEPSPSDDSAEVTGPIGEVAHYRRVLTDIATTIHLEHRRFGANEHPSWPERADIIGDEIRQIMDHAAFLEEMADDQAVQLSGLMRRFDQMAGHKGNEIGRLRKALRTAQAELEREQEFHTLQTQWWNQLADLVADQMPAGRPPSPAQVFTALRDALTKRNTANRRKQIKASKAAGCPTQQAVGAWLERTFGRDRSVEQQTLVLAEEVGELCRAVVKRAQGIRGSHQQWTTELHRELADAQLALYAIADTEGVDLIDATAHRWAHITSRDATATRAPAAA